MRSTSRMPSMRTIRAVGRLLAYRPLLVGLAALGSAPYHALPLALGLILQRILDALTGSAPTQDSLGALLALYLAAAVGVQAAEMLYAGLYAYLWHLWRRLLQANAFRGLLAMPPWQNTHSPGEVLNRLGDDPEILASAAGDTIDLVGRVVAALAALGVLLRVDATLTLATLGPMLAVLAINRWAGRKIEDLARAARERGDAVTGLLGEVLANAQALRTAGSEEYAAARLADLGNARRRAAVRSTAFRQALRALNAVSVVLATGVLLFLAAGTFRRGGLTVGELALFITYLGSGAISGLASALGTLLATFREGAVSLVRLGELAPGPEDRALTAHTPLHLQSTPPQAAAAPRQPADRLEVLEVRGLTAQHAASGRGVAGVTLGLAPRSLTVVTGRLGAGKTTLLEALLGLASREAGEVLWNGRPVEDPAAFFVPPRSAYVPQAPVLFSEALRENILLGAPADDVALAEAIWAAVLEEEVAGFPEGLDTIIGPRGVRLSGGQAQRVAAARALVREPELLVVDDLSGALDADTEATLLTRLRDRGVTCLAASHRRAVLGRADRIVVLAEGRVAAEGTPAELLETCAEFRALWEAEAASVEAE